MFQQQPSPYEQWSHLVDDDPQGARMALTYAATLHELTAERITINELFTTALDWHAQIHNAGGALWAA